MMRYACSSSSLQRKLESCIRLWYKEIPAFAGMTVEYEAEPMDSKIFTTGVSIAKESIVSVFEARKRAFEVAEKYIFKRYFSTQDEAKQIRNEIDNVIVSLKYYSCSSGVPAGYAKNVLKCNFTVAYRLMNGIRDFVGNENMQVPIETRIKQLKALHYALGFRKHLPEAEIQEIERELYEVFAKENEVDQF